MWLAFTARGGAAALGEPREAPRITTGGAIAQAFARATLEVSPARARSCDVTVVP
jgi:hypothetical protein